MLVPRSLLVVSCQLLWTISCLAIISSPTNGNGKGTKEASTSTIFKAEKKIGKIDVHDVTSRHATEDLKLTSQSGEFAREESNVDSSGSYQHHFPAYSELSFNGGEGGGGGYYHGHHFNHVHHHDHHGHHEDHKNVALKGLLVPLAGVALLGAAAALVSNPVLLQLGVITAGRKRRSTEPVPNISNLNYIPLQEEYLAKNQEPEEGRKEKQVRETINEEVQQRIQAVQVLERFMAEVPREQAVSEEKRLLAQYVSCAGHGEDACLERLTCELLGPQPPQAALDQRVMTIVTGEILENEWVSSTTKERIREAAAAGKRGEDCARFRCSRVSEATSREN